MDDSVNELFFSGVATSRDSKMGLLSDCLVGALSYTSTHYVMRSSPLCGVKVLPAQT